MASQNPYSPPEAPISHEVTADPKVIKELLSAWPDDRPMLRKLQRIRLLCYLIVILTCAYQILVIIDVLNLTILALLIAMLGGMAVSFGIYIETAMKQWPTLTKYIDWERMKTDYDRGTNA